MSAFKEVYRVYENLTKFPECTLEELLRTLPPDKLYNQYKMLEFALGAYCMNQLQIPESISAQLKILDSTNPSLISYRALDEQGFEGEWILGHVSDKQTTVFPPDESGVAYMLNEQHLFDQHLFERGVVLGNAFNQLTNLTYLEAAHKICGSIFAVTIKSKKHLVQRKMQEDWRFALTQELLNQDGVSDHMIVTKLANERGTNTTNIFLRLQNSGILETPWGRKYSSLLIANGPNTELISHLDLVFAHENISPELEVIREELRALFAHENISPELEVIREELRALFATTRADDRTLMKFLLEGISTAGVATMTGLTHLTQQKYAKDQLENVDFQTQLAEVLKVTFNFSNEQIEQYLIILLNCYQHSNNLPSTERETIFEIILTAKELLKANLKTDPLLYQYVLSANKNLASLVMNLARTTNNFYSHQALADLSGKTTGFIPNILNKNGTQYHSNIMAQYQSQATVQIGCLNIFSGVAQEYIRVYQEIIDKTLPAVHAAGGKIL